MRIATQHSAEYHLLLSSTKMKPVMLRLLLATFPTEQGTLNSRFLPLLQNFHTPLHRAARNGHIKVVGQLLAAGATVDAISNVSPTPGQTGSCHAATFVANGGSKQTYDLRVAMRAHGCC
jgi:ankyrin repeat protein